MTQLFPLNPAMAATDLPPVMEARRWIEGVSFPADRPLINVSQAAPVDLPPLGLRQAIADAALNDPNAHLYGPVLGLPELRAEIATQWSRAYDGIITAQNTAITQGCNQAFCAVLSTLAGAGDEVILPCPWYFNHKMWLDMAGITTVPLSSGPDLIPTAAAAEALITPKTKAIVLVTPNNPGGVEYPAQTLTDFRDLARRHGLVLIVDETYRDFHSQTGRPHDLFTQSDWGEGFVQLYSFSKAYRLTGHRVGSIVASQARLAEVEKFLDTVAICPNQLGQIAALWGMRNLGPWVAQQRTEILARRDAMIAGFAALPDWTLLGCGAYFAYVNHPFDLPSVEVCKAAVTQASILMLRGSMFQPATSPAGQTQIRIAFANIDRDGIAEFFTRLAKFHP